MLHPAYGLRPAPLDMCKMRPSHRGVVALAKAAENISAAPTFTLTARATASTSWVSGGPMGWSTPALFTKRAVPTPLTYSVNASAECQLVHAGESAKSSADC